MRNFFATNFEIGAIIRSSEVFWRSIGLDHRYTRSEVERMMGITRRELNYWIRLRLVFPRARWGERFFNFSDLVALETIKRLASRRVPARTNSSRAITALESELWIRAGRRCRCCDFQPTENRWSFTRRWEQRGPYEPLTGQFVIEFRNLGTGQKNSCLVVAVSRRMVSKLGDGL